MTPHVILMMSGLALAATSLASAARINVYGRSTYILLLKMWLSGAAVGIGLLMMLYH